MYSPPDLPGCPRPPPLAHLRSPACPKPTWARPCSQCPPCSAPFSGHGTPIRWLPSTVQRKLCDSNPLLPSAPHRPSVDRTMALGLLAATPTLVSCCTLSGPQNLYRRGCPCPCLSPPHDGASPSPAQALCGLVTSVGCDFLPTGLEFHGSKHSAPETSSVWGGKAPSSEAILPFLFYPGMWPRRSP